MCHGIQDTRFTSLGAPRRVWAVSAIHGELDRVYALHDAIITRIRPGDRLVYLGNYTGHGQYSRETVDELLTFRRLVLAQPGMIPSDIVYLRGHQENLWHRLINLPFAQKPVETFDELLRGGIGPTLESYGIRTCDGIRASKEGVLALTRWIGQIREAIRKNRGHDQLMTSCRRAAYTVENGSYPLLFVNAGLDPKRPLEDQGDILWDSGKDFYDITQVYAPYGKIIRGYDPTHEGVRLNCVTASLDGGSGFGGSLVCAGFDKGGRMTEMLEA